jgi:hypothetical protein
MAVYVCSVVLLDNIESWMFLSIEEELSKRFGLSGLEEKANRHNK